jgi:fatty-acyl-CoA synthase
MEHTTRAAAPAPAHHRHWPPGVPKTIGLPRTSLVYNLEVSARRYPGKAAVVYYDSPLSYQRMLDEAEALAGYLAQVCGVRRGDRVLLFMQNSPQFAIAFYAILRADAMVVPVNPMNLTEELRHYVSDSDAKVAMCGQELYPQLQPLLAEGALKHVVVAAYADYGLRPPRSTCPRRCVPRRSRSSTPAPWRGATRWPRPCGRGRTLPARMTCA